jgi:ElaB/YqjD/DUF883 family membrane-anchored ribosome-binding protein
MEMALFRRARREDLASRLERKGSELSQTAAEKGAESSRRVADILRRASEDIQSMGAGEYRERIMSVVDSAHDRVDDTADMARDNIRSHPLTSIAVAMGIGILAGAAISLMGSRAARMYRE